MTTPLPVYLVFGSKVVKAMDILPGKPEWQCNHRYYAGDELIRNAGTARPFPTLAAAKAHYEGTIAQHERSIKAYRKSLAAIEAEIAREVKGDG